ncbi:acyl--CoA ligase [bacterium]|nr:acyl--CoA ligase [bacterium]
MKNLSSSPSSQSGRPQIDNLSELLAWSVQNFSQETFLESSADKRSFRYVDLQEKTQLYSKFFKYQNVEAKESVVFFATASFDSFSLLFAAEQTGATLVILDPDSNVDDLLCLLKKVKPKLVIYQDQASFEKLKPTLGVKPVTDAHFTLNQIDGLRDSFEKLSLLKLNGLDSQTPALIVFSSGSTGKSKGIPLSSKNLVQMALNVADFYEFSNREKFMSILPHFHINSMMFTGLAVMANGSQVLLCPPLDLRLAKTFWAVVEENSIETISLTPSIMAMLLRISKNFKKPESLRRALVGTAALKEDLWLRFEKNFGIPCYQGYGLTETSGWVTMTPPGDEGRHTSVGVPVGHEIKIEQRNNVTVSDPRVGEVLIKGDCVFQHYFQMKKKRSESFVGEWLCTGDLGYFDEEQRLHIVGRVKNIVKRRGNLIVPEDVDSKLLQSESIKAAFTFGVEDELAGENLITLVEGDSSLTPQSLSRIKKEEFSNHERPDQIRKVEKIPRNKIGKYSKLDAQALVSGEWSNALLQVLEQPKFCRNKSKQANKVLERIQNKLESGEDIVLSGFWGVSSLKSSMTQGDEATLENLFKIQESMQKVAKDQSKIVFELILSDLHGRTNGIPEELAKPYFSSIKDKCMEYGFQTIFLSQVWEDFESKVNLPLITAEMWEQFCLRDQFVNQAAKLFDDSKADPSRAKERAYSYFQHSQKELPVIEAFQADKIAFSFNSLDYLPALPKVPTVHFWSVKKGVSDKPWFII